MVDQGLFRSYQWDPLDQLVSVTSAETLTTYEYDTRLFLRSRRTQRGGGVEEVENFGFDEMGAPFETSKAGGRTYAPGGILEQRGQTRYRYDRLRRLVEKEEAKTDGSVDHWKYEWDEWGMLGAVETPRGLRIEYLYDAYARRMQKKVYRLEGEPEPDRQRAITLLWRTDYVWAQSSLLQQIDFDLDGKKTRTRTYLYEDVGDYLALGHRDDQGPWRYYFSDPNGTPEEILDQSGNRLGQLSRSAYGRTELVGGSRENTQVRFPGQVEDPETGLHYNRYRYYDPDSGRYISPDPIGLAGGHDLFDYGPNPVNWFDSMGWEHVLKIKSAKGGDKKDLVDSRNQSLVGKEVDSSMGAGCPKPLDNRACCHTERKSMWDMDNPKYAFTGSA